MKEARHADVPVVFFMDVPIGAACPGYQLFSLLQARRLNAHVVLISRGVSCRQMAERANATFVDIGNLSQADVRRVDASLPRTIQKFRYERNNHVQWIQRAGYMSRYRVPWALHCDSDAMLGVDASSVVRAVRARNGSTSTRGGCTVFSKPTLARLARYIALVYETRLITPSQCGAGLVCDLLLKPGYQQSVCDDMTTNDCFAKGCFITTYSYSLDVSSSSVASRWLGRVGLSSELRLHRHVDVLPPYPGVHRVDLTDRSRKLPAFDTRNPMYGERHYDATAQPFASTDVDGALRATPAAEAAGAWPVVSWRRGDGRLSMINAAGATPFAVIALHFVGGIKHCMQFYWERMQRRDGWCAGCECRPLVCNRSASAAADPASSRLVCAEGALL
jgi:hypothetical protein